MNTTKICFKLLRKICIFFIFEFTLVIKYCKNRLMLINGVNSINKKIYILEK